MTHEIDAPEPLGTHQKVLNLNLDPTKFGSFAEIGAGQEVARWFLTAGAASGTVAKTISAYDKEVSDDLYGAGTRYVSRQRLEAMLEREWTQLQGQLRESRGARSRFFAFADTVAARNYAGTNECHGWMGVEFQERPDGERNQIVLHVNMRDHTSSAQGEALGLLGVNLIYAVFHQRQNGETLLRALTEGGLLDRIEIDLVDLDGPVFTAWDRRLLLVGLAQLGMAEAVIFPVGGEWLPPTEVLHRRPVVVAPDTFEHVDALDAQMLGTALEALRAEVPNPEREPVGLFSLAADPLAESPAPRDEPSLILARVEALLTAGHGVLVARHGELYGITAFINRFTAAPVRFAVGLMALARILHTAHYRHLEGRILEGIARLLAQNVRIYAYPMSRVDLEPRLQALSAGAGNWELEATGPWVTADQFRPAAPLGHLYAYLIETGFIAPMRAAPPAAPTPSG